MAEVQVSETANRDLDSLIETHRLPADTRDRVARVLRRLERFPRSGTPLSGRWSGYRFVLGPWRWMILVYAYLEDEDRAVVTTIQDGLSSMSPTASRSGE